MMNSVQHAPEDIAFEDQGGNGAFLLLPRATILGNDINGLVGVAGSLDLAIPEIGQAIVIYPVIPLLEGLDALLHQIWGEQFCERCCNSLDPGACASEVDVGIHGETNTWHEVTLIQDRLAAQAHRLGQLEPVFDPALASRRAIMVENALKPDTAH